MADYIASGTTATFSLAEPDSTKLTLTVTLTADEWRSLMRQLPTDGCAQTLGFMVSTMLGQMIGRMNTAYTTTGWSGANPVDDPAAADQRAMR